MSTQELGERNTNDPEYIRKTNIDDWASPISSHKGSTTTLEIYFFGAKAVDRAQAPVIILAHVAANGIDTVPLAPCNLCRVTRFVVGMRL